MGQQDPQLETIITAAIPRKCFVTFLANYPLSGHPLDVRRLDRFTCAVARYSRKKINWTDLGEFLRKVKRWQESDAEWCLFRIQTGLDVIREYKRFR